MNNQQTGANAEQVFRRKVPLIEAEKNKMVFMLGEGKSVPEIASELGRCREVNSSP